MSETLCTEKRRAPQRDIGTQVNTFQLVIGFDERDAYALLLYPEGGIQWIQADGKVPSLPDAKAQAGFMSGDNTRYTLLRGSGTDHVVNLDKLEPFLPVV